VQAGKLKHLVTIETVTVGKDPSGGKTRAWAPLANVWADVKDAKGRAAVVGHEIAVTAEYIVEMRYRDDFDETARIIHKGKPYVITHMAEMGRGIGLRLLIRRPGAES
jgi:SPP1 family predicted phage head-tail adaptor